MLETRRRTGQTRAFTRLGFAALLLVAAGLRLQGLDWDEGHHLHPDERFLTMVTAAISGPESLAAYFDTANSPLNPSNQNFRFFVYGTLPVFVTRAVASAIGLATYEHIPIVGRALAACWDLGTVVLTAHIGLLLGGPALAFGAAALVALCVLSLQQSHFFTVDTAGTFFATAALLALLHVAQTPRWRWHLAFGLSFGLALGCRVNLAPLVLPYGLAMVVAWRAGRATPVRLLSGGLVATALAAVVFRLVQPYAFTGPGVFNVGLARDFVDSLRQIRALVSGEADYPPSVQWIGRTPVLFAGRNVLGWGLGPAWGIAVPVGVAWCLVRWWRQGGAAASGALLAAWTAVAFVYLAAQLTPSGRYFLPLVPAFALLAAWPLTVNRSRRMVLVALIALTALWAVAFTAIYRRPHTRVEASRWIYANVPAGATIATEHWDDGLPLPIAGATPSRYRFVQLELYAEDDARKREQLVDRLVEADWIVISSNRLYRSIPRAPWRWPLVRRYYELLFSGALGFELEHVFTSYPRLGPLEVPDAGAEEAFTVYDHPTVLIFRKGPGFSRAETEALLGAVRLGDVVRPPPREAGALYRRLRPTDVPLPGSADVRTAVAPREVGSLQALAVWLLVFEVLWAACFILLAPALGRLPDAGVGLAAVVAWLAPGWLAWLVASLGVPIASSQAAWLVAGAIVVPALVGGWWRRRALLGLVRSAAAPLAHAQAVFLVAFAVLAVFRAFNPAIYWGEKPMDFSILNAVLRARTLPPADPWFAGETLSYPYFGYAVAATFARLTAVPAALAFNLAVPTVGALLAVGAFTVGRLLGSAPVAGVLAAVAVSGLGNLAGPRLLLDDPRRALDFDYYWATSRVIDHTINEFPFWNLLFADLHPHVMAQPLLIALVAAGAAALVARDARDWPALGCIAALAAWLAGAVAATNPWSVPTVVAVTLVLALLVGQRAGASARTFVLAALGAALVLAAALLLFQPFWASFRGPAGAWGWETQRAPVAGVLTVFGVFLVAALPPLVWAVATNMSGVRSIAPIVVGVAAVAGVGLLRSPAASVFGSLVALGLAAWLVSSDRGVRAAALLAALAGAIGMTTEYVYVWDRMNTVFKYYLDAWLLLGPAAAVLVVRGAPAAGAWRRPWLAAVALAATGGAVTSVTAAVGFIRSPHVPSDVPTLDGMAYLRQLRPAELAAYEWLNHEVPGSPVLLEAQGAPYQEFTRVAMNTGLPTPLGWEYHLLQQGRSRERIERRRADVHELFATTDWRRAARLLARYRIDLVFVGPLERRTYPAAGLRKFDQWTLTRPVFRNREVTIHATPGLLAQAKTWVEPVDDDAVPPAPLGSLREPRDVARTPDGALVVADFANDRLQRFGAGGTAEALIGEVGSGPGEFRDPCGIDAGPDGRLYVADTWNHRVQVLSPAGEALAEWRADLYGPRGIALAPDGSVYVTDTGHHRVVRFGAAGEVLGAWGDDVLTAPIGIAVRPTGEVLVADPARHRIVVFSPQGAVLEEWPVAWRDGARLEPYLDVGPDGVVWVTDPTGDQVLLFDATGRALGTAMPDSTLRLPLGIAVTDAWSAVVTSAADGALVTVRRAD